MTPLPVRWTRRALRRLDEIGAYIAQDNPPAAERVVARIATATDMLATHPAAARQGRIRTTRELVLADISYIVVYRVGATRIDILIVMHVAQKWPIKL